MAGGKLLSSKVCRGLRFCQRKGGKGVCSPGIHEMCVLCCEGLGESIMY